jgi:hypothetical protein
MEPASNVPVFSSPLRQKVKRENLGKIVSRTENFSIVICGPL